MRNIELKFPNGYVEINSDEMEYIDGGVGDPKVDFVSKILLNIYGILLILLDNHLK